MARNIFLATNNAAKVDRFRKLLASTESDVVFFTPKDMGVDEVDIVENGSSLMENAAIKAHAYFGKVSMPILANDTGFWVAGEGLVDTPKRTALGNRNEEDLTKEEIAGFLVEFWKGIAKKHGGSVDAAWVEAFLLLSPDGTTHTAESRREVILTDREFGSAHIQMPVRALYISKATGKPSLEHSEEEELAELKPVIDALIQILGH